MLSPTYEITTALSHTDELISPPYDIAIVTISYGRVIMSSVWDSMMSKKNVGWPFYAAVKINESNEHLNSVYWWIHTRVNCPLCQGTRFIILSIFHGNSFLEVTFEIDHKEHPTPVRNWVFWGGLNYFYHIFAHAISNAALNWTAKYPVGSSTVLPSMLYFHWQWILMSLYPPQRS